MYNEIEAWVPIVGSRYEVSSKGNVRAFHHSAKIGPKIRQLKPRGRYKSVTLYIGGEKLETRIHNLVAKTFHGPRPPEHDVHHADWNRDNNEWGNLKYLLHNEHMGLKRG